MSVAPNVSSSSSEDSATEAHTTMDAVGDTNAVLDELAATPVSEHQQTPVQCQALNSSCFVEFAGLDHNIQLSAQHYHDIQHERDSCAMEVKFMTIVAMKRATAIIKSREYSLDTAELVRASYRVQGLVAGFIGFHDGSEVVKEKEKEERQWMEEQYPCYASRWPWEALEWFRGALWAVQTEFCQFHVRRADGEVLDPEELQAFISSITLGDDPKVVEHLARRRWFRRLMSHGPSFF